MNVAQNLTFDTSGGFTWIRDFQNWSRISIPLKSDKVIRVQRSHAKEWVPSDFFLEKGTTQYNTSV
jgi:hypothetical protein